MKVLIKLIAEKVLLVNSSEEGLFSADGINSVWNVANSNTSLATSPTNSGEYFPFLTVTIWYSSQINLLTYHNNNNSVNLWNSSRSHVRPLFSLSRAVLLVYISPRAIITVRQVPKRDLLQLSSQNWTGNRSSKQITRNPPRSLTQTTTITTTTTSFLDP